MKNISLLGSTGSIGRNVLRVARSRPSEFRITALAAGRYSDVLEKQIKEFRPSLVAIADLSSSPPLARAKALGVEIFFGDEGLKVLASSRGIDIVFNAVVGAVGVYPLAAAIESGKTVALANKESVVIAGDYIRKKIKTSEGLCVGPKPKVIPVDSEHSAIFQCLEGRRIQDVSKIIITASGGSLYGRKPSKVSVEDVLRHPTWKMGKKITVDSATLMNKGLEVIEAHHLFGLSYDKISTVIHPQSIVHSLVEFVDGSLLAQLSLTDMRYAIQYALTYPVRLSSGLPRLSLESIGGLDFKKPDFRDFPCFGLAVSAGLAGGIMPAVMNAANEIAVGAYLSEKISFVSIPRIVEKTMAAFSNVRNPSLDDILEADKAARERTYKCIR
ncbi:MAG: 1-deoxy-D-xylulose-5-phosphate reductoisomerase [Endomicrobiia bacterium]|nr:1-deoxy-D-xylulose-5-phosphate reductoisomerase [Endomicrobiia bacterium]